MTPRRTCIGCRSSVGPDSGIRVALAADGGLLASRTAPGRGAWLCRASASACAATATRRRAWGRALRSEIAPAWIEQLQRQLDQGAGVGPEALER